MIFLGCLTFGLLMSFIITKERQITTLATGAEAGAIIGLFVSLFHNYFMMAMNSEATFLTFAFDVVIGIVMSAISVIRTNKRKIRINFMYQ